MKFDFHIHGLWLLGSLTLFAGILLITGIEWTQNIDETTLATSVILGIAAIAATGILWISSAINTIEH